MPRVAALLVLFAAVIPLRAGLHYSGEPIAELPSRWRGFLLDQRTLRQAAVAPAPGQPESPVRTRYQREADRLAALARTRTLSADESADLGALLVRLGNGTRAIEVLRAGHRLHPLHYRLAANLGTAWQLQGDLDQAASLLEQAVRLAPGKTVRAEELHLRLVRQRRRERPGAQGLDDLFGVTFIGPTGRYEAGRLAAAASKELPLAAAALTQQLALWLPADGRLLWQLAELANAHGDVTTAAAILDGCVSEFHLRDPLLLAHRRVVRAAADARTASPADDRTAHAGHTLLFRPRSSRPLTGKLGASDLPPIDPLGKNLLAWEVITETVVERGAAPAFSRYLRELDGRQVVLRGYIQPLADNTDLGAFLLLEHPVGCWFCETPDRAAIVLVELPEGQSGRATRDPVRVSGRLLLNARDPETYFYIVRDATVADDPGR